jgi:hypothetical protein
MCASLVSWTERRRWSTEPRTAHYLRGHVVQELDETLMTVVNVMGVVVFSLVIAFHFVTSTAKDAEA